MKNHLASALLVAGLSLLMGCERDSDDVLNPVGTPGMPVSPTNPTVTFDPAGHTLLAQGTFVSNVHPTSGAVKLYEKAGKRTLVFDTFKTDGGPDLRIYLSESTGVLNFIEVSRLSASGTFFVELPSEANPQKQRFVLIWCKAFSVLFGNAELK
jgi:hypothetical protein